jgi:hypothetical protein
MLPLTLQVEPNRRNGMSLRFKVRGALFAAFLAITSIFVWNAVAQDDVVHIMSGVIKHVDKGAKTVVIKTADGTEQTVKYTDKTVVEGTKDVGKGIDKGSTDTYLAGKKGAKVTVKYVGKGADKTAVGVKDAVD